ncbi:hypothetical protein [Haloechinothrix sp. LS1_15]|uniref:hypothetical protein n=1 Tax=Haloechinothrix sp. LS1_15 TaxID=2652248 RepID=UPI002944194A|nr:hypothetical protein [Haloechinothrix sp. LS1_15]
MPGPDTRVVELRVPGLVGLSGERLLDTVSVVTVAGDEAARIVRPSDRQRRPAPGPVLQALRRALPRTLEGYLWHKMTSGGAVKATWALLFPFALANVAQGMLPAPPRGHRFAAALSACLRALLRVVGVLLTVLFITQLGVVTLDLIAATCLSDGPAAQRSCLGATPAVLQHELLRTTLGVVPLLLLIGLLHRVSSQRWVGPGEPSTPSGPNPAAELPGVSLVASHNARVLRGLHTLAALAAVALLPIGGAFTAPVDTGTAVVWAAALAVLAVVLVAAAMLDEGARWLRTVFSPAALGLLTIAAVALVGVAVALHLPLERAGAPGVPGIDRMVEGVGVGLLAGCLAFASLLVPYTVLCRVQWSSLPQRLRPWLGGWAAAPTLILASLTGAGFGAGMAIAVRELLGVRELPLPPSYTALTLLWGAGTIIAVVLLAGLYGLAIPMRRRARGCPRIVEMLHESRTDRRRAAAAWATSVIERKHLHRLVSAVALLLAGGALALVVLRMLDIPQPGWLQPLSAFGVVALGLLAAGLLRVVYTAARSPERNRHLGALADLVYFWPRAAHPIVPPSYALKVVGDLTARARHHLEDPPARVVISGYSHGGLLALLATARLAATLDDEKRSRLGLLTAGTPLQWGYQRAFPSLLPHTALANLYGSLDGRWRGLCRGTDPFGGGVTTWRHQILEGRLLGVGYLTDGGVGPLPAAYPSPSGALVLGGDHWLPDPIPRSDSCRRWEPGVLRHADYLIDPEWDRAVAMAAGLERPGHANGNGTEQHTLFGDLPAVGKPRT